MAFIVAAFDTLERRRRVQSVLAAAGHTVVMFCDGAQALAEVVDGMPDAVVIGDQLRDLTVPQFRAALQEYPQVAEIPVVIGSDRLRDHRAPAEAGCTVETRPYGIDLPEAVTAALSQRLPSLLG